MQLPMVLLDSKMSEKNAVLVKSISIMKTAISPR